LIATRLNNATADNQDGTTVATTMVKNEYETGRIFAASPAVVGV
jgi:hypothetical protein